MSTKTRYYRSTIDYLATRNFDRATCTVLDQAKKNKDEIDDLKPKVTLLETNQNDQEIRLTEREANLLHTTTGEVSNNIIFDGSINFNNDVSFNGETVTIDASLNINNVTTINSDVTFNDDVTFNETVTLGNKGLYESYTIINGDITSSYDASTNEGNFFVITDTSSQSVTINMPHPVTNGFNFKVVRTSIEGNVTLTIPTDISNTYDFNAGNGIDASNSQTISMDDPVSTLGPALGLNLVLLEKNPLEKLTYYVLSSALDPTA